MSTAAYSNTIVPPALNWYEPLLEAEQWQVNFARKIRDANAPFTLIRALQNRDLMVLARGSNARAQNLLPEYDTLAIVAFGEKRAVGRVRDTLDMNIGANKPPLDLDSYRFRMPIPTATTHIPGIETPFYTYELMGKGGLVTPSPVTLMVFEREPAVHLMR